MGAVGVFFGRRLSASRFSFAGSAFLGQTELVGLRRVPRALAGKLGLEQGELAAHTLAEFLIEEAAFAHAISACLPFPSLKSMPDFLQALLMSLDQSTFSVVEDRVRYLQEE